jgi:hypothetical protein
MRITGVSNYYPCSGGGMLLFVCCLFAQRWIPRSAPTNRDLMQTRVSLLLRADLLISMMG